MRWKFFRDTQSMYTCLWCCHVKLGSVLLGISSLLIQLTILSLVFVAFFNPGAVPSWISSFVTPGNINEGQNVINLHELPQDDPMMHHVAGSQPTHHERMMGNHEHMMGSDLTAYDLSLEDKTDEEDGIADIDFIAKSNSSVSKVVAGVMGMEDKSEISLKDVSALDTMSMPIDKADVRMQDGMGEMYPKQFSHFQDVSSNTGVDLPSHHTGQMDSDDKFLLFVILIGSIVASLMLIKGVVKSQPSYLMPYMGLQVFEFSVTGLTVFSCFSYVPDIKHWISVQPDSLPLKNYLMSVDTDRLILSTILLSVSVLVMKAYFMGIVWSCYKYLVQNRQEAAHGRRRLVEEDLHNPEDAELLLPPKYEDIVNTPAAPDGDSSSPPPPPYQSA